MLLKHLLSEQVENKSVVKISMVMLKKNSTGCIDFYGWGKNTVVNMAKQPPE